MSLGEWRHLGRRHFTYRFAHRCESDIAFFNERLVECSEKRNPASGIELPGIFSIHDDGQHSGSVQAIPHRTDMAHELRYSIISGHRCILKADSI